MFYVKKKSSLAEEVFGERFNGGEDYHG